MRQRSFLDDLSTGTPERVGDATLVTGSVLDTDLVTRTLREHDVKGIVHVAAKKQVGESVERPSYYYRENVDGLLPVLDAATATGVESFVFSSSAAVYGMPSVEKVTEDDGGVPLSPYGQTKLIGEWVSRAVGDATGMRVISLRYFNVAGAGAPELGDPGAFNLIPMVFEALAGARRRRCSATTTRHRTAPASATTCTSPTSPTLTPRPFATCATVVGQRRTTSGEAWDRACSRWCGRSPR